MCEGNGILVFNSVHFNINDGPPEAFSLTPKGSMYTRFGTTATVGGWPFIIRSLNLLNNMKHGMQHFGSVIRDDEKKEVSYFEGKRS